ncbi:hypothetical protein Bca4012_058485 [Brassica carinata]
MYFSIPSLMILLSYSRINAGDDEFALNGVVDVIESNKTESIPNFRVSLMKVVVEQWRSGGRFMMSYGGDGRG